MADYLLALTPAVLVGLQTLLVGGAIKGDDRQKPFGMLLGGLLVALIAAPFLGAHYTIGSFLWSLLSGALLAWGVRDQIVCMQVLGVSRTMPLSTGAQLITISTCGILLLGEWRAPGALPVGLLAMVSLIVGMWFVSRTDRTRGGASAISNRSEKQTVDWPRGLRLLVTSTLGLTSYLILLQYLGISGQDALLPQAIGWSIAIFLLTSPWISPSLGVTDGRFRVSTLPFVLVGFLWGTSIFCVQLASARIGVAAAFTFSQLGVVISTLGGILWLKERRTKRELLWTGIGLTLVVLGAVLVGVAKGLDG